MSNSYYNAGSFPATGAPATSASMRAELGLIAAGFDKLPTIAGNAGKLVAINEAGTALVAGGSLYNVDFLTAGTTDAVGRLTWNDTDGTLNLGLKGGNVVLQVGQEEVLRALNTTGVTLTSGQVVYVTGASGQRPTIALAQANAEMTSTKVVGIVTETIANNAQGFVTTSGLVRGFNTSAFAEGAVLWLSASTAGGITSTRPSAPNHGVLVGYCVRSHASDGIIYVMVQNGYELDELHDVLISGLANNNMLRYNASSGVWQNIAGPAGAVVGTTDAQTLSNKTFSDGPTFSAGTANGVAFLNGSKVLTTGSALTFDGSNLGIGVAASSWANTFKSLDMPGSSFAAESTIATHVIQNAYYNGSNWIYKATAAASRTLQYNGQHYWYTAPSGTAGNAISFTQAMTLDANGRLAVGATSVISTERIYSNGSIRVADNFQVIGSGTGGAATSPSYTWGGQEATTGMFLPLDKTIAWSTNGVERLRLSALGNIGHGVAPSAWGSSIPAFEQSMGFLASTGTSTFTLGANSYNNGTNWIYKANGFALQYTQNIASGDHLWFAAVSGTAGATAPLVQLMALTAGGALKTASGLYVGDGAASNVSIEVGSNRTASGASFLDLVGDTTYTDFGTRLIREEGGANAGTSLVHRGTGVLKISTSEAAPIVFEVTTTERARIDTSGNFLVGTTSLGSNTAKLYVNGGIGGHALMGRQGTTGTSNGSNFNFWWTGTAAQLWVDTTNVGTLNITSDYRVKKNVETQTVPAIERVMRLRPVTYELADYGNLFKADGVQREGFIAHEVQEVIPSGAEGVKDEEGRIQNLRTDAILSVAVKAIQELKAIVDAQAARIAALEAA